MTDQSPHALKHFLLVTFFGSVGLAIAAAMTGVAKSPISLPLGLLAMLLPTFGIVVTRFTAGADLGGMGWRRWSAWGLVAALLVLPLIEHAVSLPLLTLLEGHLSWSPWLTPDANGILHPPPQAHLGASLREDGLLPAILSKAAIGLLLLSPFALAEEVGWRGFMQPRLVGRLGVRSGLAAGALLWAAWHSPFALSGLHDIAMVPKGLQLILIPIGHIGVGLFIGALYQRTSSIWVAILAHASLNSLGQFAFKFLEDSAHNTALLTGNNLGLLAVGILSLLLLEPEKDNARISKTVEMRAI